MKLGSFYLQMSALVAELIPDIADEYRATDDPTDDTPAMSLTIGADADGWSYQTGDNSFTGGAYGYADWSVVTLYRDSDPADVAEEIVNGLCSDDADAFAAIFPQWKKPDNAALDCLRNLTRYRTHGGYTWAGLTDDGALLCVPCMRSNYRQVFTSTRDEQSDGWAIVAHANSGDSSETEHCAHCNKPVWEH